jgi:flagellum-specific ATP synthase
MEGDDHQDPIVDAVRSYVDGHIMLSRPMALDGWYPPIDVLGSISRLMPAIVTPRHAACAARVRRLLAAYAASEDLIRIGAYKAGSDPALDQAILLRPRLRQFLEQSSSQSASFAAAAESLEALVP